DGASFSTSSRPPERNTAVPAPDWGPPRDPAVPARPLPRRGPRGARAARRQRAGGAGTPDPAWRTLLPASGSGTAGDFAEIVEGDPGHRLPGFSIDAFRP